MGTKNLFPPQMGGSKRYKLSAANVATDILVAFVPLKGAFGTE